MLDRVDAARASKFLWLLVGWSRCFLITRLCLSFQLTPLLLLLFLLLLQRLSVLLR